MKAVWELGDDAEDGSWASWRLDDMSYSLWATADTEGFWQVGHSTWSREDGHDEHVDHEGQAVRTTDEGPDPGLDEAKAAAEAKLVEVRAWLDQYEREIDEALEGAEAQRELIERIQDEEAQVLGEVN